jgi:diadenylate cyclase
VGALIIMERSIGLSDYFDTAIKLDALVSKELLVSLFWPHNPTHDGAVIIQGDRAVAAGCLMPLSRNPNLDPTLGTRHRAAVGITEQSDALALVVSETSGQISLAQGGKLRRDLTRLQLRQSLRDLETPAHHKGNWFEKLVRHLWTP